MYLFVLGKINIFSYVHMEIFFQYIFDTIWYRSQAVLKSAHVNTLTKSIYPNKRVETNYTEDNNFRFSD